MPSDFSRVRFEPQKHYCGVLMQQGRVQLDADWNEQWAIEQHRTETEAIDVIGHCGVPKEHGGFALALTPDGKDITISAGRLYADGLMCEAETGAISLSPVANSTTQAVAPAITVDGWTLRKGDWVEIAATQPAGKQVVRIDAVDGETRTVTFASNVGALLGAEGPTLRRIITYTTQPDFPHPDFTQPPAQPPGPDELDVDASSTYLIFVDAWKLEVTPHDDPTIREIALGPADTTTRPKTVWQVKLLKVAVQQGATVECDTPFTEWDERIAPATGLLNARTKPADPAVGPCALPPEAGYRRLENQLYRIQVHSGGERDDATFKWSRDNASVETVVEAFVGNAGVRVADLGKDQMLGFAGDQWVEIVDEESELKAAPHDLAQIKSIDPSKREITMMAPLTVQPNGTRRKLRRWDHGGSGAGAEGLEMASDWIDLEGGIQVRFEEGTYRSSDYWLIPARTASGDIEWPPFEVPNTQPLPQTAAGIRHHYCRIGILTVQANGTLSVKDCRDLFPPLTDITADDVSYDPGACPDLAEAGVKTVQEAIDHLCGAPSAQPGIGIKEVLAGDGQPLRIDTLVPVSRLASGFSIVCDALLSKESFGPVPATPPSTRGAHTVAQKPTCTLTLDLPYPIGADRAVWELNDVIGFQPVVLSGLAVATENVIEWRPAPPTGEWLKGSLFQRLHTQEAADRVLARVCVKGNFIWRGDATGDPDRYVDGDAYGRRASDGRVELKFPTGDGRRGGDFEMWFWLMAAQVTAIVLLVESTNNVITGSLRDASGVSLAGVNVAVTGPAGVISAVTNAAGQFRVQVTTPGTYRVSAQSAAGSAEMSLVVAFG